MEGAEEAVGNERETRKTMHLLEGQEQVVLTEHVQQQVEEVMLSKSGWKLLQPKRIVNVDKMLTTEEEKMVNQTFQSSQST